MSCVILMKVLKDRQLRFLQRLIGRIEASWSGCNTLGPLDFFIINTGLPNYELTQKNVNFEYIPSKKFSHGGARNLIARKSRAKFVVYLSSDIGILPNSSNDVFCEMCRLLEKGNEVAAVFARQVSWPTASLETRIKHNHFYPPRSRVNKISSNQAIPFSTAFFSNVCAMYRRDLLLTYPFDPGLIIAEDLEWNIRILKKGYTTRYLGTHFVFHSHDFKILGEFRRMVDDGFSKRQISQKHHTKDFQDNSRFFLYALKYIWKSPELTRSQKIRHSVNVFMENIIRSLGYLIGRYLFSHKWPKKLKEVSSSTYHFASLVKCVDNY